MHHTLQMYRIVCSNPYSVDRSVDIEDDEDDEEVGEIDWHFIICQAGLGNTGLFFQLCQILILNVFVTFTSIRYDTIVP